MSMCLAHLSGNYAHLYARHLDIVKQSTSLIMTLEFNKFPVNSKNVINFKAFAECCLTH